MQQSLLEILVDPFANTDLSLVAEATDRQGNIISGSLRSTNGRVYSISNGIPRFVDSSAKPEQQTRDSFGFKWSHRNAYEAPRVNELNLENELARFGFRTPEEFRAMFQRDGWVLDMGCGSGHYASLYVTPGWKNERWVGTDFSSGIDTAQGRLGAIPGTNFVQADMFHLPYRKERFDLVVCRGVMHHTMSTERAFHCLAPLIRPGGEFIFLVYKKNGPVREFTDDYVRQAICDMPPAEAWEALKPLTKLGKALSKVDAVLDVEEDIPYLEIKAGKYDLRTFLYDHFLKAYWNDSWTLDESNLISFDWYHPKYAFRHSEDEIRGWCDKAGLEIVHIDARWTSWAVRAVKRGAGSSRC